MLHNRALINLTQGSMFLTLTKDVDDAIVILRNLSYILSVVGSRKIVIFETIIREYDRLRQFNVNCLTKAINTRITSSVIKML
mgnify:CR=1 FL=1